MRYEKSLTQKIYDYLVSWHKYQPGQWVNGGEIERLAQGKGFKASNASRRCRELVNGKYPNMRFIERRENDKGCVEYRYMPTLNFTHEGQTYQLIEII